MRIADGYTRIVSSLIFPVHEWIKGHSTTQRLRFLEESQWWARERLDEYRIRRLRGLLEHAAWNVPYYRMLFSAAQVDASRLRTLDDLHSLPFLTKGIIRDHLGDLKAERGRRLSRFNTGGSTGEPLIFFTSKERVSHDVAAKWRATRWWGVDIGDPEVVVWGSPIELNAQDRMRTFRDRLLRTRLLSAFEMSPERLDGFVETLRRARPRMLFGYPSAISLIGRHAQTRGARLDDLGIEVAFVTAEQLYDHQREEIQRFLGCRVANGYGGRDAGFVAHECPEGGMHITAEDVIVEIVDDQGRVLPPGQAGEVVVTHLATKDFPFVRYRTGDVAAIDEGTCPCGRGLPLLKEIRGRTTDFIVAEDGTVMHALALIYIIRDVPCVENFRIVQEDRRTIRVELVTSRGFTTESEERIKKGIARRVGGGVRISVDKLQEIPREASGKHRYVVSRVAEFERRETSP